MEARAEVIQGLGMSARQDKAALDAILAALGDPAFEVRWRAVNALRWCAEYPKLAPQPLVGTIIEALTGAADDESAFVRAAAVGALARIAYGTKVENPRVIEALGDPVAEVRLSAACYLGWKGKRSPMLVPALIGVLTDSDPRVRENSAKSLGYLGLDAETALPALRSLENDPESFVRDRAAQAISTIEKSALTLHSTILPHAIAELDDADPASRALAASRIGDIGSRASDAVPALVRRLADREADVRCAVAGALGQLGSGASVAIPTLESLAGSDPDERVRRVAKDAAYAILGESAGSR